MPKKTLFILAIFCVFHNNTFSQKRGLESWHAGINLYSSINRVTLGINIMYKNKKSIYFYLSGNWGITGYKQFENLIYEKIDSFKVGNSNTYSYAYNIPNSYATPYDENNTINIPPNSNGYLNNYEANITGSFLNLSIGIPVNYNRTIYAGINTSYFWNTDKGKYTYTALFPKEERRTRSLYAKFQTLGIGMFTSYMYHVNKRIMILPQLNFNFYFPITNPNYGVSDSSNPLFGTEIDLSISINYKF